MTDFTISPKAENVWLESWHAGYPLNAFAMLMIRVDGSGDTIDVGLLH